MEPSFLSQQSANLLLEYVVIQETQNILGEGFYCEKANHYTLGALMFITCNQSLKKSSRLGCSFSMSVLRCFLRCPTAHSLHILINSSFVTPSNPRLSIVRPFAMPGTSTFPTVIIASIQGVGTLAIIPRDCSATKE